MRKLTHYNCLKLISFEIVYRIIANFPDDFQNKKLDLRVQFFLFDTTMFIICAIDRLF